MLAQLHDIRLRYPDKTVLDGVSLAVHRDDRIALVGENGAGKTSLFRILRGELVPDGGRVAVASGVRIGYLAQSPLADVSEGAGGSRTVLSIAREGFAALQALERAIAVDTAALARAPSSEETERLLRAIGEAQERFEREGGYTYRARTEAALRGVGLTEEAWPRPAAALSAGQQVRLALVRLLLADDDLLLLDEPTNHLDLPGREWLERWLAQSDRAYVVASHDRRFLDAVATKVAHLDRGRLTLYAGNYTSFRAQAAAALEQAWRTHEKRERLARRLEAQARAYRTWAQSRERDKHGRVDKGYVGHKAAKLMKRSIVARRQLEETIERMRTEKPRLPDPVAIAVTAGEARTVLTAEGLEVGYDPAHILASGVSFVLAAGDRLAVLGPNGSGKTTVLRTLLGEMTPLAGTVRLAPTARPGYFDQEARTLPHGESALEAVLGETRDETLARTVMGRLRIRRDSVHKPVGALSAGERAKVLLARLMLGRHTLLLLDEPTNYLDLDTQDVLLEALAQFPGAIVFTSHDRHFIEMLATTTLRVGEEA